MTSAERPARYAWMVVALLLPVALLNYLDRQMVATMKASMVGDIPDDRQQSGLGAGPRIVQVDVHSRSLVIYVFTHTQPPASNAR